MLHHSCYFCLHRAVPASPLHMAQHRILTVQSPCWPQGRTTLYEHRLYQHDRIKSSSGINWAQHVECNFRNCSVIAEIKLVLLIQEA